MFRAVFSYIRQFLVMILVGVQAGGLINVFLFSIIKCLRFLCGNTLAISTYASRIPSGSYSRPTVIRSSLDSLRSLL